MSIEYKFIDEEEAKTAVVEGRAREAAVEAQNAEMELRRLEIIASRLPESEKGSHAASIAAAKRAAASTKARYNRIGKDVLINDDTTLNDKRQAIKNNLLAIEYEHAARSVMVKQRQDSLKMKGLNAPTAEEAAGIKTRLEEDVRALENLEVSWELYNSELAKLPPEPEQSVAPPEATPGKNSPVDPRDLLTPEEIEAIDPARE